MNDEGGNGENGEFDAKTFLYVRDHPGDTGSVPTASPFWLSPDITIVRPGGIRGTEAVAGEADQVEVRVLNDGGIDATDVYVEAFVADPSTAFTPVTAKPVGSGFLAVPNHGSSTITFPWTPTAAETGHRCLLARICLTFPMDCYANGAVFDVTGDRHVAQRNVHVTGFSQAELSFGFWVVNPGEEGTGRYLIKTAELKLEDQADSVRRALGSAHAQFAAAPLRGLSLNLGEIVAAETVRRQRSADTPLATGVLGEATGLGESGRQELELEQGHLCHAVLTAARDADARPGDLSVVQVEQVDVKTGQPLGGLWLVLGN